MGNPVKLAAAAAFAAFALGASAAIMSPKAAAVVMDQGARLPAGYTQLEYIQVSEQGGFNLGVKADSKMATALRSSTSFPCVATAMAKPVSTTSSPINSYAKPWARS